MAVRLIGAQLGARCAVKFGARLIKPLLISICCLMAMRYYTIRIIAKKNFTEYSNSALQYLGIS